MYRGVTDLTFYLDTVTLTFKIIFWIYLRNCKVLSVYLTALVGIIGLEHDVGIDTQKGYWFGV